MTYFPGTPDDISAAPIKLTESKAHVADFKQTSQTGYAVRGRIINALPEYPRRIQLGLIRHDSTATQSLT